MSASTKGVILTSEKDFWVISHRIGRAIQLLNLPEWNQTSLEDRVSGKASFTLPKLHVNSQFGSPEALLGGSFMLLFRFRGEDRILYVNTDVDCDLKEDFGEEAEGIVLSLNHWGSSVVLMEYILEQLTSMGDCYINENDADRKGYHSISTISA